MNEDERTGVSTRSPSRLFTAASILLFLISLTQDGYRTDASNPRAWSPAIGLLLVGCLGIFDGIVAWLANPTLLATWILTRSPDVAPLPFGAPWPRSGFR